MRKWLLPEYIEDILPEPARRMEAANSSRLLNCFNEFGRYR